MHNAEAFLNLWAEWDEQSRMEVLAIKVCDAMIELGDVLGLKHMEVRRRLSNARRSGMSYRDAYDSLIVSAR